MTPALSTKSMASVAASTIARNHSDAVEGLSSAAHQPPPETLDRNRPIEWNACGKVRGTRIPIDRHLIECLSEAYLLMMRTLHFAAKAEQTGMAAALLQPGKRSRRAWDLPLMTKTKSLTKCVIETSTANELIDAPRFADRRTVSIDSPKMQAHIGDLADLRKVPPGSSKMPNTSSISLLQTQSK